MLIAGPSSTGSGDQIQADALGAVAASGVYALPYGALADGGAISIPHVGETVPATLGGNLNINTASERDFRSAVAGSSHIAQTTHERIRLPVTV